MRYTLYPPSTFQVLVITLIPRKSETKKIKYRESPILHYVLKPPDQQRDHRRCRHRTQTACYPSRHPGLVSVLIR